MKRITLLSIILPLCITATFAQKRSKKDKQPVTAYAITSMQKGQNTWTEVRLIDVASGQELKTVYQSNQEVQALNARTGNPIVKKDITNTTNSAVNFGTPVEVRWHAVEPTKTPLTTQPAQEARTIKKVVDLDVELDKTAHPKVVVGQQVTLKLDKVVAEKMATERRIMVTTKIRYDKPFSTNSAACAYDKKHERLYYTPLGINQLRYIDLKSSSSKVYYFEDEAFGVVTGYHDVANQITRMVIDADGDGYALTNNGEHLLRFGTDKKAAITDLGSLTDDSNNGEFSIHSPAGFGGDMVADGAGDLYLITANRNVYKIDVDAKIATYKGNIKGLPRGYSTNGAIVEDGSSVIVNSANSTDGYYRFDINTLQAAKVSNSESVFNSSDLAGSIVIDAKKKKKEKQEVVEIPTPVETKTVKTDPVIPTVINKSNPAQEVAQSNKISVYPNPITNNFFKLSFEDQPAGKYQVQVIDIAGQLIQSQNVTINNKVQVEEFRLPQLLLRGNYLVKVVNEDSKIVSVNKVVVQ